MSNLSNVLTFPKKDATRAAALLKIDSIEIVRQAKFLLEGLKDGEQVVTSANFLIDSESQLKSATGGMSAGPHAGHGGAPPAGDAESSSTPQAGMDHSQHGSAETPGDTQTVMPEASPEHAGHVHTGN